MKGVETDLARSSSDLSEQKSKIAESEKLLKSQIDELTNEKSTLEQSAEKTKQDGDSASSQLQTDLDTKTKEYEIYKSTA